MTATGKAADMNEAFPELAAEELDRIAGGFSTLYQYRWAQQQPPLDTRIYPAGVRNPLPGFSIFGL